MPFKLLHQWILQSWFPFLLWSPWFQSAPPTIQCFRWSHTFQYAWYSFSAVAHLRWSQTDTASWLHWELKFYFLLRGPWKRPQMWLLWHLTWRNTWLERSFWERLLPFRCPVTVWKGLSSLFLPVLLSIPLSFVLAWFWILKWKFSFKG